MKSNLFFLVITAEIRLTCEFQVLDSVKHIVNPPICGANKSTLEIYMKLHMQAQMFLYISAIWKVNAQEYVYFSLNQKEAPCAFLNQSNQNEVQRFQSICFY